MLVNISYHDGELEKMVQEEVGKALTLKERFRLGGSGSPRLMITKASYQIQNILALDNNLNVCNIELRKRGIIIRFRALLDTYALIIPFHKLKLFKGDAGEYTFYNDHFFIRIAARTPQVHRFISKLSKFKVEQTFGSVEDL